MFHILYSCYFPYFMPVISYNNEVLRMTKWKLLCKKSFWICSLKFWIKRSFFVDLKYISFKYTCVYRESSMSRSLRKNWYLKAGWKSLPQRKGFFSVLLMCEKTSCWTCWKKKTGKWLKKKRRFKKQICFECNSFGDFTE